MYESRYISERTNSSNSARNNEKRRQQLRMFRPIILQETVYFYIYWKLAMDPNRGYGEKKKHKWAAASPVANLYFYLHLQMCMRTDELTNVIIIIHI